MNNTGGLRIQLIEFWIDISRSMKDTMRNVKESLSFTLEELTKQNDMNEDIEVVCRLHLFNDHVSDMNVVPLLPGELREGLSDAMFTARGRTHLGLVYKAMDSCCTRTNPAFHLHKGDPIPIHIMITDYRANDDVDERQRNAKQLMTNRLFLKNTVHLCVFVGDEKDKGAAESIFGKENIISLSQNLADKLSFVLATSTVDLSVETHLPDYATKETAYNAVKRDEAAKESIEEYSDLAAQIRKAILEVEKENRK